MGAGDFKRLGDLLPQLKGEIGKAARKNPEVKAAHQAAKAEKAKAPNPKRKAELERLRAEPPGPNLPPWLMHNPSLHVVEGDLEDVVADDFGQTHYTELRNKTRELSLPPLALGILTVLSITQGLRPALRGGRGLGSGAQLRPEWWSKKLGCVPSYYYWLAGKLEEGGYLVRGRRTPRYSTLTRRLGFDFGDPARHLCARQRWMDGGGKLHQYADVRGVLYITRKGAEAVASVHDPVPKRPGERHTPFNALEEVLVAWRRFDLAVRRRLAPAAFIYRRPYEVRQPEFLCNEGQKWTPEVPTGPPKTEGVPVGDAIRWPPDSHEPFPQETGSQHGAHRGRGLPAVGGEREPGSLTEAQERALRRMLEAQHHGKETDDEP